MNTVLVAAAIAVGSWIPVPGGAWSPDASMLVELRRSLQSFVVEHAAQTHEILPAWSRYTFQYQGQLKGGAKVIFVNAFCDQPPSHAQKEFVRTFDAGPCYFNLKYDPVKREFFGLQFNGVA